MGILENTRGAVHSYLRAEPTQASSLKRKIRQLEAEAAKQGKVVQSLTIALARPTGFVTSQLEPIFSDVGSEAAGVAAVSALVHRDGFNDVLELKCGAATSVAEAAIWCIENEERLRKKKPLFDVPSDHGHLLSFSVNMIHVNHSEKNIEPCLSILII